jgi:hypothetical protein
MMLISKGWRTVPIALLCWQVSLLANAPLVQQVSGQDLDKILERADKLLDEAKVSYENAREKNSVETFVEAGFKLEEARIKYIVLQEIGSAEKQKLAADRLRAVNQLSKLIHDGKVACNKPPSESAPPKPSDPAGAGKPTEPLPPRNNPSNAAVLPVKAPVDVSKRAGVPDQAKQREAEKLVKELFREQYSKKAASDRKVLGRLLMDQAAKTQDDPTALWVLYREAQDAAIQSCDVVTIISAIETAARFFDIDSMSMKNAALTSASKVAKSPEESLALVDALLALIDDQIRADQYDAADKAATLAVQLARKGGEIAVVTRATTRSKEVSEAKGLFQSMKTVLQTLAKNPEDASANFEMGKFLCFVKGSWDLGLRFLVKGSEPSLKMLAEKEIAAPAQISEQVGLADGWWELAEKEKSSLRKSQLQAHAKALYEAALPEATGLLRAKIEKRLEAVNVTSSGESKQKSVLGFNPIGTWTKQDTGTLVTFKPGGVLDVPKSRDPKYTSGKWDVVKDTVVITYSDNLRLELRIVDNDSMSGTNPQLPWELKRNK